MKLKLLFLKIKRWFVIQLVDWYLFWRYELKQPFVEVKSVLDFFTKTINRPTTFVVVSVLLFTYSMIIRNVTAQKISFLILLASFIYKEKISGHYKGEYRKKFFSEK